MCCVMPPASPRRHLRLADGVEQARLAVVDVAHDRHDRRARHQLRGVLFDRSARARCRGRRRLRLCSATCCSSTARSPSRCATIAAVSKSMTWLMEAITPFFISSLMTSTGETRHQVAKLLHREDARYLNRSGALLSVGCCRSSCVSIRCRCCRRQRRRVRLQLLHVAGRHVTLSARPSRSFFSASSQQARDSWT